MEACPYKTGGLSTILGPLKSDKRGWSLVGGAL
jgi:hypothetical protein